MHYRSRFQLLAVIFATVSPLLAQKPSRIVMSPVPIFEENSAQSSGPAKTGAFFDVKQNQLVLVLPGSGPLPVQLRFDIPNGVNAAIGFSLQPLGMGTIKYEYSLSDDTASPQRSNRLMILLPNSDSSLAGSGPWVFERERTSFAEHAGAAHMGTMTFASWRDPSSSEGKIAGLVVGLESTWLPGFADAFVEGHVKNPLGRSVLAGLPLQIAQQVEHFLQPGIGNSAHLVIAPLFRSNTPKIVVAANYHFGISALRQAGRIGAASPYADQLLQSLSRFVDAGGTGVLGATSAAPDGPLEKAIQQAVALALK